MGRIRSSPGARSVKIRGLIEKTANSFQTLHSREVSFLCWNERWKSLRRRNYWIFYHTSIYIYQRQNSAVKNGYMKAMEIFGFLVIEVFNIKIFVFLWLKYFRLKYSRDMDRNTRMMKIFLRAWIVIEVFGRIPAKVSPSNVSWTSLFCISYVRGGFVIKEMLNFLRGIFSSFHILLH